MKKGLGVTQGLGVTVTHTPTKRKEACDTEASQLANKRKALGTLRAKIWEETNRLPPEEEFTFKFH